MRAQPARHRDSSSGGGGPSGGGSGDGSGSGSGSGSDRGGDSITIGLPPAQVPNVPVPPGTDGVQLPDPVYQSGAFFTKQGQRAQMEAGEAILSRSQAEQYRRIMYGSGTESGKFHITQASRSASIRSLSPNEAAGFAMVPGLGYVPTMRMAAASGRLNDVLGPNAQRDLQRAVLPVVETALRRRSLSRAISEATALTQKGKPSIGGS